MTDEMKSIANSWWMYALGAFVTIFIVIGTLIFVIRAWKRGRKIGMSKETLKDAVVSSAVFSIAPSVGIYTGLVTLAGVLGVGLPWIRLSIIGALHYELQAASTAASSSGLAGLVASQMTPQIYATMAVVMTLGIIWGPLLVLCAFKKYSKGIKKVTGKGSNGNRFISKILFNSVFIGLVTAYLGQAISYIGHFKVTNYNLETGIAEKVTTKTTFVPLIVFGVAFLARMFFDFLVKKFHIKWLEHFSLTFSMFIGMGAAILCVALGLNGNYI